MLHGRSRGRLGIEAIADAMGMSVRSAEYAVAELETVGWVTRKPVRTAAKRNGFNIYRIPRITPANSFSPAGLQPIAEVFKLGAAPAEYAPTYDDACQPSAN